jgi:hypothetical protein
VACRCRSLERTILSATWLMGQTLESGSMDQLLTQIGQKYQHRPTPPLPRLSPTIAGCERSNPANRSGAQSPCRPHTGSQRLLYAGSPKETTDVAPSHRTTVASRDINVKAHQILTRRMPHKPRCIPPSEQEMQNRLAHDKQNHRSHIPLTYEVLHVFLCDR